jgi:hypothetical protein
MDSLAWGLSACFGLPPTVIVPPMFHVYLSLTLNYAIGPTSQQAIKTSTHGSEAICDPVLWLMEYIIMHNILQYIMVSKR